MGRKRKQIDPKIVCKTSLPPCRVCAAPGAGFHYGVNTCEACKGFFHRSLKIWTQYTCDHNGNCIIELGQGKLCQHCRYQKCLSVGMAKEAIKTGRYPYVKRTKDFLEMKSLQDMVTSSDVVQNQHFQIQPNNGSYKGSENYLDSNSQSGISSCDQLPSGFDFHCNSGLSDSLVLGENSGLLVKPSLIKSVGQFDFVKSGTGSPTSHVYTTAADTECFASTASLCENDCLPSCTEPDLHHLKPHHQELFLSPSSSETPSSIASPASLESATNYSLIIPGDASSSSFTSSSSPLSTSSAYLSTSLQSPQLWTSQNSPATSLSPASSATHSSSSTSLLHADVQTYLSHSPNPVCDMYMRDCDSNIVSDWFSDRDTIVRRLMEADEHSLVPLFGNLTDEDIQQEQLEHIESCKLKREMFGQLYKLPDQEYDDIFVTTGLDADDRQKWMQDMGVYLEKMIRAMVKFCKAIPGFSKLSIVDKVKLIKYSRHEFYIFVIYRCINSEKRIIRGFDNQWKCENELTRMSLDSEFPVIAETLDLYFKFCHRLQNLKLSQQELVVIRALIVMAPDRDQPVDSPLAQEIHWQLTLCLIHILTQRYPKPLFVYAKIVDSLIAARSQTEGVICFLKRLKIDKYSDVMQNPLLREMCGGIFFDDDDVGVYGST